VDANRFVPERATVCEEHSRRTAAGRKADYSADLGVHYVCPARPSLVLTAKKACDSIVLESRWGKPGAIGFPHRLIPALISRGFCGGGAYIC
jgi:hypothetical protein